jgi:hypothetical protein
MNYEHDLEKHPAGLIDTEKRTNVPYIDESGAVPGESFEAGTGLYAKLQRLAGKFNIEQRGIERVPENERTDTSLLNIGTMVRTQKMLGNSDQ